ncbi:MAG: hypothetical protein HY965_03895 [Ignavibacteriales bacterium]|nr:hypothetical protein [Ignavibacteriales bacterium]
MQNQRMFKYIPALVTVFCLQIFAQYSPDVVFLPDSSKAVLNGAHHLNHFATFAGNAPGYNQFVIRAIDAVQKHAMDGGTYFIGIKAVPTESPVNYELKLGSKSLLTPPRLSSYCSGSTYAAFIETLNLLFPNIDDSLSTDRLELLRMQEPDGGRREDYVKFWGKWNADGNGCKYALVDYSKMGVEVKAEDAKPGDFANIAWTNGGGHSVVFLGWYLNSSGEESILYWSSQKGTNGYGDQLSPLSKVAGINFVRLVTPEGVLSFER